MLLAAFLTVPALRATTASENRTVKDPYASRMLMREGGYAWITHKANCREVFVAGGWSAAASVAVDGSALLGGVRGPVVFTKSRCAEDSGHTVIWRHIDGLQSNLVDRVKTGRRGSG